MIPVSVIPTRTAPFHPFSCTSMGLESPLSLSLLLNSFAFPEFLEDLPECLEGVHQGLVIQAI